MIRSAALLALALCLAACGGGNSPGPGGEAGGGGASTGDASGGGGQQPAPRREYYVDPAGNCAGRQPCYSNLRAAALASFESQFEIVGGRASRARRPNDPADNIIVMPGTYRSSQAGEWVLLLGMNAEDFPPGIWKVRLTAEQGPALTTLSGDGTGPCLWITDFVDVEIKGFTVTGCAVAKSYIAGEYFAVFIQSWSNARIRLEGNWITSNSTVAAVGFDPWFSPAGVDAQVVRNRLLGNHSGVIFSSFPVIVRPENVGRFVIANNLIAGSSTSVSPYPAVGIALGPETIKAEQNLHIEVFHNTVVGHRDFGVFVNSDATETIVQDNIVFGNRFDIYGGTALTTHNLVGETANLYSTGNVVGDPLFVDAQHSDFRLQPGSPAIDTAAALSSSEAGTDYNGTVRPLDGDRNGTAVADMGAIEYMP